MLKLNGMEIGEFSISYRFKNIEDGFCWVFIGVYGPTNRRLREAFLEELGAIKSLWQDPWYIGEDFNVIRFMRERIKI